MPHNTLFCSLVRVLTMCIVLSNFPQLLSAKSGDTIKVRTVEFGAKGKNQRGWFQFPPKGTSYQRIWMNYKLKCPANAPCGEWDYLMYVFADRKTGRMDSNYVSGPNFTVNGSTTPSLSYLQNAQAWSYFTRSEASVLRTATQRSGNQNANGQTINFVGTRTGFDNGFIGGGALLTSTWNASELKAAGVLAGEINGLRFQFDSASSQPCMLNRCIVTMWSSSSATKTVVHNRSVQLHPSTSSLAFSTPFQWDGVSDITVNISYENKTAQSQPKLAVSQTSTPTTYAYEGTQMYADFDGKDYIITNDKAAISTGSIDAWFNVTSTSGNFYILSNDRDAGSEQPGYHLFVNNGKLSGAIWRNSDQKIMTAVSADVVQAGTWNHAAMTFNGTDLVLYLNGKEVARVKSAATTIMTPEYPLMIGVLAFDAPTYYRMKGGLSEIRIWNSVLTSDQILSVMNRPILEGSSEWNSLVAYYPLTEGRGMTVNDKKGGKKGDFRAGKGNWEVLLPSARPTFYNSLTNKRPLVLFEQGQYTQTISSVTVPDSTLKKPVYIVRYANPQKPGQPTDTLVKWLPYYRYRYSPAGALQDSVLVSGDSTLTLSYKQFYSAPFEIVQRYELLRYITPYGNGLSLGNGVNWRIDVTDYAPILFDSVYLDAYNSQEDVELTFDMIEGTPARTVQTIQPLWLGNANYQNEKNFVRDIPVRKVFIPANTKSAQLLVTQSGHGFGGNENCAEFCDKKRSVKVNGQLGWQTNVWRSTCGLNPIYPQGGTWLYNRSNWCPGDEVVPVRYEIFPKVKAGDSAEIALEMDAYTWNGQGSNPYYSMFGALFTYGDANYKNEVSLERILAPSDDRMFNRMNPICESPVIKIRNNGAENLTSLLIKYSVQGSSSTATAEYQWTGSLGFLEEKDIALPPIQFPTRGKNFTFRVELLSPNGKADENTTNNTGISTFQSKVPTYYPDIQLNLTTNKFASDQYELTLKNSAGQTLVSRSGLADYTKYVDSLNLPYGCYELRLINKEGYGLDFWAMRDQLGSGLFTISSNDVTIRSFNPDFGSELFHQFRVGDKPQLRATIDTLNFGTVAIGKKDTLEFEVYPTNSAGSTVYTTIISGPANRGYKLLSTNPAIGDSLYLEYGQKMKVTVEFAPTTVGVKNSRVLSQSDDERNGDLNVFLVGNATQSTSVQDTPSDEVVAEFTISAEPSLTSEFSTIRVENFSTQARPAEIIITNSIGKKVLDVFTGMLPKGDNTFPTKLENLPNGVYMVIAKIGLNTQTTKLMIVK